MKMHYKRWLGACIMAVTSLCLTATVSAQGDSCQAPITVSSLPYLTTDNTSNYGDEYESADRPALDPNVVGTGTGNGSYLGGDDVVYAYTPSSNETIDIDVTGQVAWTGVFVFTGCPFGNTVGYHTSSSSAPLSINGLPVTGGTTYYIVISTWPSPQSTDYTLEIDLDVPDCPGLGDIGDPCDDGNPNTVDDVVTPGCTCEGSLPGQCLNDTQYPSSAIEPNVYGDSTAISGCNFQDEYSQITNITAGYDYEFHAESGYITVRSGAPGGTVLGTGNSPVTVTAPNGDDLYVHWNTDATCGTASSCIDTWFYCLDCAAPDCNGVPGGPDRPGTACDDGNPNTANDTWDENCNCVGVPMASNDEACSATVLACGDTVMQSFAGATMSMMDSCSGSSVADVWFTFTANGTQTYTVGEGGGDYFDGVVQLFKSNDCNNLVEVGECADFPEEFDVTEAGRYFFRIRPWSTSGEDDIATVSLTCTPFDCPGLGNIGDACDDGNPNTVNDQITENCTCEGVPMVDNDEACSATTLACGDTVMQSFAGATMSIDDDCFGSSVADVWFTFTANGTQTYTVGEGGGDYFDAVVQLFKSDDCNNLVEVGACADFPEEFEVTDPGTYYFRIRPYFTSGEDDIATVSLACSTIDCPGLGNIGDPCDDGNPNTVDDTVTENCECVGTLPPSNDDCSGAMALQCDQPISSSTDGATSSGVDAECNGFTSSDAMDVWYGFVADGTSDYTVTVYADTSAWDGVLFVYSGECDTLVELACSDTSFSGGDEAVTLNAPAAGIYYVRFFDYFGTADYTVELTCDSNEPPCEDPFPAADGLNAQIQGNGVMFSWNPVPGQIGCQFRINPINGGTVTRTISGANASEQYVPGQYLSYGTTYTWGVRCGCSQNPIIAGPWVNSTFTTPGGAAITSSPNPTSDVSNVRFDVVEDGHATLEVYDMNGRSIQVLYDAEVQPGQDYRFEFNGAGLPAGVYIYRLTTESEVVIEKFMITR